MYDFCYVTKKEAKPLREDINKLLNFVQNEVRNKFTFQFKPVGSSSRNMITRLRNGNIGFDFDFNIEPNVGEKNCNPNNIRKIIFEAISKFKGDFGYTRIENSTSVITIKAVDRNLSRILYSCDFAIVHNYNENGSKKQEYICLDKRTNNCSWEERGKDYYIEEKIKWLKAHKYWTELRDYYIEKKNKNNDSNKHSRNILAESVNEMCQKKGYPNR